MEDYESLGFVETMGLVAAIEAADAMVKAARVRIKTVGNADAGLISVICEGDLAACMAAVEAGKAAAQRMGGFVGVNLIPRPYSDTEHLVTDRIHRIFEGKKAGKAAPPRRRRKSPTAGGKK